MRSKSLLIILLLWTNYYLSQTIPEGTKHIQNIDAVTFENGDTLKSIRTKTYYDSTWHIITYNNTSSSSTPKGTRTVRVIDTPKKKQDSNISQNGDTTSSYVYIYDESGNRIEYYQIEKHDTINKEKRTYDEHNNELTLWKYGESDYYLKYINEYDDSNNVIKRLYYNENGRNIETEITKRDYKKGTIKTYSKKPESPIIQTSDVLIKDGILISKHLKASEAINYGIYLIRELGGYTETKKNGKDLVWMKIYNSKSELTTSINVTYQEYP